jgi:hypothetical protein
LGSILIERFGGTVHDRRFGIVNEGWSLQLSCRQASSNSRYVEDNKARDFPLLQPGLRGGLGKLSLYHS